MFGIPSRPCIPKRYILVFMVFIGYVIFFGLHANIGMAVVDMTSIKKTILSNGTVQLQPPEFAWDSQQRSLVLSSFAYGRLLSPIGGILAGKLGGSRIYAIGILGTAIINAVSPFILQLNFYLFILAMSTTGVFESFAYSAVSQIWSRWLPPDERARCISFSVIGVYGGFLSSFLVAGWILSTWNWAVLFYVSGIATFVWFVIWILVVKDDPSEDTCVGEDELKYIQETLNNTGQTQNLSYPWKDLLTCMPFWITCLNKFSTGCCTTFTVMYLPQYIKDINDIDIKNIGYLSSLPQICSIIATPLAGYLFDFIRSRNLISVTNMHKLYTGIGLLSGSLAFVVIDLWPNLTTCIICLSAFQFFLAFVITDIQVTILDLAPRYAAFMNGVATSFYTLACIVTPAFVGFYVTSHNQQQWSICFLTLSTVLVAMVLLHLKYSSGELQSWANYVRSTPRDRTITQS